VVQIASHAATASNPPAISSASETPITPVTLTDSVTTVNPVVLVDPTISVIATTSAVTVNPVVPVNTTDVSTQTSPDIPVHLLVSLKNPIDHLKLEMIYILETTQFTVIDK